MYHIYLITADCELYITLRNGRPLASPARRFFASRAHLVSSFFDSNQDGGSIRNRTYRTTHCHLGNSSLILYHPLAQGASPNVFPSPSSCGSTTALTPPQITIDKEQLVPAAEFEGKGSFESDFELFGEGVVEDQAPAYYLYR
jgi:hypothetical protein